MESTFIKESMEEVVFFKNEIAKPIPRKNTLLSYLAQFDSHYAYRVHTKHVISDQPLLFEVFIANDFKL